MSVEPLSTEQAQPRYGGRFDDDGPGLRERTARGTLVNAAFMTVLASIGFLKSFLVAGFLTAEEYGLWGILVIALGTLTTLKQVGVGDKFIQQDDEDQEAAFQKAFTIDTLLNVIVFAILLAAIPGFAALYGRPEMIVPGLVLSLAMLPASLQAPIWVYYRQMRFVRQRTLAAINPIVAFIVTIGLAVAGYGYWSLVVGQVAGVAAGGLVAALASPYRLAFRYDRGTARDYFSFSWPLLVASLSALVVAQVSVFVGEATLGLAGAGAIALASGIALYTNRVGQIVTQTLYPAVCAVKDRTDLLFESFVKSNRIALMWGLPFGIGLALFAPDLVRFGYGEHWEPAIGLLQVFGVIAGVSHIGFNWQAFYQARGETRPVAAVGFANMLVFCGVAVPLLITHGLAGFGLGMALTAAVSLVLRTYYLTRLFPGFAMLRHAGRALAPLVPAVAVVLLARLAESGERTLGIALGELMAYVGATIVATLLLERALLREMLSYVATRFARQPA